MNLHKKTRAFEFCLIAWPVLWTSLVDSKELDAGMMLSSWPANLLVQVVEAILDDDNDMQDMYLGRRAAVEALAKQQLEISSLLYEWLQAEAARLLSSSSKRVKCPKVDLTSFNSKNSAEMWFCVLWIFIIELESNYLTFYVWHCLIFLIILATHSRRNW